MNYYGKSTLCGTFAVLNAVGANISPDLFELTTGVPFGIRCVGMEQERFLTPYRDPNFGLDQAVNFWKLNCRKVACDSKEDVFHSLCRDLDLQGSRIVLGPLNMGKLFYIPLCGIYENVDHYIMVRKSGNREVTVVDSEGYTAVPMTYDKLYKMWNIRGVYEAGGIYTYRCFEAGIRIPERKEIENHILNQMLVNMKGAERDGQGARAFMYAYDILSQNDIKKWFLSFLYEIEHLIQRKMLVYSFCNAGMNKTPEALAFLKEQIAILMKIYRNLEQKKELSKALFQRLSHLEYSYSLLNW